MNADQLRALAAEALKCADRVRASATEDLLDTWGLLADAARLTTEAEALLADLDEEPLA